jgi:hypothetical protein
MAKATTDGGFFGYATPFDRRQLACWAAFYFGIPVALALYAGAAGGSSATFVAKRYYFYYFLAASLPAWWIQDIATRVINRVLKPWGPPLVLVLILGAVAGMNIQGIFAPFRQSLFEPYLVEGSSFYQVFPWRYGDPDYLIEALIAWTTASVLWVAANLFFIHWLNFPRFGHSAKNPPDRPAKASDGPSPAEPMLARPALSILLEKLPEHLGTNVVALKAEEHYTRVYTDKGEKLILMRFSDAVELLGAMRGVQTHRSYWVNADYISDFAREGRTSHVHLTTGIDVPVSRSYRVKVREALDARPAA